MVGILDIQAFSRAFAFDKVDIESVSFLVGASAGKSHIDADLLTKVNVDGATIENKGGDVYLSARSQSQMNANSNLMVASGLTGVGVADVEANVNADNQIVLNDATIKGEDVDLLAGRDSGGNVNIFNILSSAQIVTFSLVPSIAVPIVDAIVDLDNTIIAKGDTTIEALEDVTFGTTKGNILTKTEGTALSISLIPYGFPVPDGADQDVDNRVIFGDAANGDDGSGLDIQAGINNKVLFHIEAVSNGPSNNIPDGFTLTDLQNATPASPALVSDSQKALLGLSADLEYEYALIVPDSINFDVTTGTVIEVIAGSNGGGDADVLYSFIPSTSVEDETNCSGRRRLQRYFKMGSGIDKT